MGNQDKPKLSIKKQIERLKSKGIKFEFYSETDAYYFLQNNSYLFKLKAYCNTYKKKDALGKTLPYQDLDFAYLVDLSIIDMHLRRFLIEFTLDIEHILKTKLIRDFNTSKFDGYDIVRDFLHENTHAKDFIGEEIGKIRKLKQNGKDLLHVSQFLLEKYEYDLAIWNFIEVIQFGILVDFAKFFYDRHINLEFDSIKHGLFNVKFLRNSAAHNNCMLADLKNNIQTPQKQIVDEIYRLKIFKRKTRTYINNQMKNRVINDFVTAIFIYDRICKSRKMKIYCYKELQSIFLNRLVRNRQYYERSHIIKTKYIFCFRIVKYFNKISNLS